MLNREVESKSREISGKLNNGLREVLVTKKVKNSKRKKKEELHCFGVKEYK